ncbi:hypothetical protein [Salinisphaera orenii]|uniref:hypothetical protein n=1 Tax=Salinisphaera orenii TaxID=856731 RepID=UPI000DBE72D4
MSRSEFIVTYDGPALKDSEMDVRDLSPALLAISNLVDRTNTLVNDNRAAAKVVVRGSFRTGSFGIDLGVVQPLASTAKDLFTSDAVTAAGSIASILGLTGAAANGLIKVVKSLRGRPIHRVVPKGDDKVELIVDDDRIETEQRVLEILRDPEARRALEDAVYEPLSQDGIDTFAVQEDEQSPALVVEKADRHWFRAPPDPDAEVLSDDITDEHLQLVSVAFRDDNKWRVSDGVSTFHADMEDADYLRLVDHGDVRFSANDLLYVQLRRRRYLDGRGKMKVEAAILKVIEHRAGARQYHLGVSDEPQPDDPDDTDA